jgi:hypothetical protein
MIFFALHIHSTLLSYSPTFLTHREHACLPKLHADTILPYISSLLPENPFFISKANYKKRTEK